MDENGATAILDAIRSVDSRCEKVKKDEPVIIRALRSKDAILRTKGANQAGEFGLLGLRFTGELLRIVTRRHDEARAAAIGSLRHIASGRGLGPFTNKAVYVLIRVVKDATETEFMRSAAAAVLSYCVFSGDHKFEVLQNVEDTVRDLLVTLKDERAVTAATESLMRIEDETLGLQAMRHVQAVRV